MDEQLLRKLIREEINSILNEGIFYRLPGKIVANDFYTANKDIQRLYEKAKDGLDFVPYDLSKAINKLNNVLKSAKKFNTGDNIPDEYK